MTVPMINIALRSMKNNRASGPEGIPAELLKNGSIRLKVMLSNLMTRYINGGPIIES